jgi:hypothetical protein
MHVLDRPPRLTCRMGRGSLAGIDGLSEAAIIFGKHCRPPQHGDIVIGFPALMRLLIPLGRLVLRGPRILSGCGPLRPYAPQHWAKIDQGGHREMWPRPSWRSTSRRIPDIAAHVTGDLEGVRTLDSSTSMMGREAHATYELSGPNWTLISGFALQQQT